MKEKIFMIIFMCLSFNTYVFSQKEYDKTVNQFNSKGQKEGLWIDGTKNSISICEVYYKNDILSGTYKEYDPDGRLLTFGEYNNGQRCGTWFFFENTGHLWFIFKNFEINTDSIINEGDGRKYVPDYKCYSISYYPNGNIQDEGVLLWPEGEAPESDASVEYGEWKYYDESGKLIKTVVY